jgi:hypothetical protein
VSLLPQAARVAAIITTAKIIQTYFFIKTSSFLVFIF